MVRFSIITVLLNPGRFLLQTIRSVLVQDYGNVEYIMIDGGSTDGSIELIKSIAYRDERVIWTTAEPRGIADAMNRGLALARGEVVAYLHADDYYPAVDVLATVAESLRAQPDRVWLTGGVREVDADGRLLRKVRVRKFSFQRLLRNNIILHPATFVRRESLNGVGGFDAGLLYAMDYNLWLKVATACGPPIELDRELACFRVHGGGLSSANRRAALEEEYRVRRRYLGGAPTRVAHALYQYWRRLQISCDVEGRPKPTQRNKLN